MFGFLRRNVCQVEDEAKERRYIGSLELVSESDDFIMVRNEYDGVTVDELQMLYDLGLDHVCLSSSNFGTSGVFKKTDKYKASA